MFDSKLGSLFIGAVLFLAVFSGAPVAADQPESHSLDRYAAGILLANKRAEVQSRYEFRQHLRDPDSPLHALSRPGLAEFRQGLVFTEAGLGSMNYAPLVNELNEEEIYRIFKLFGVQFESDLYSPDVFDEEDRLMFELMDCEVEGGGNVMTQESGDVNPMCHDGGYQDEVCVQFEDGRRCARLPMNVCTSKCYD